MSLDLDKSTWKRVAFGGVVRNVNVSVRDAAAAGIERAIAMEHLDPGELKIERWGAVSDGTTFTRRVTPGQTLFGRRRAYQRKVAYAEFDAICSGDILTFEADDSQLLPEFLPFLVQSDGFFDHALGTSAGSLSPRTNWGALADFEFDLPPLDEQKRIADLLWAVEQHREAEQRVASSLKNTAAAFRQQVFDVPDPDRLDAHVDVQLGQQRAPQHAQGGHVHPYVRAANVTKSGLDVADLKEMNFEPKEWEKFRLRHGDVLVTEGCGSLKELGNSAVWFDPGDEREMFFQKTLLRLRAKGPGVTPSLVREWALWAQESGRFASVANGTGILHITGVRCSGLPFPRMTDEVLGRFSRDLDSVSDALKAHAERIDALVALRSSLLNNVFGVN